MTTSVKRMNPVERARLALDGVNKRIEALTEKLERERRRQRELAAEFDSMSAHQRRQLLALWLEGRTQAQVALGIGCAERTVRRLLRQAGLATTKAGRPRGKVRLGA